MERRRNSMFPPEFLEPHTLPHLRDKYVEPNPADDESINEIPLCDDVIRYIIGEHFCDDDDAESSEKPKESSDEVDDELSSEEEIEPQSDETVDEYPTKSWRMLKKIKPKYSSSEGSREPYTIENRFSVLSKEFTSSTDEEKEFQNELDQRVKENVEYKTYLEIDMNEFEKEKEIMDDFVDHTGDKMDLELNNAEIMGEEFEENIDEILGVIDRTKEMIAEKHKFFELQEAESLTKEENETEDFENSDILPLQQ